MNKFLLVVGFCLALGQNATNAPSLSRDVCKEDIATFCSNEQGRSRCKCLRDHLSELSPDCSAYVVAKSAARQEARAACGSDARRLCPDFLNGDYILLGQCLIANSADLSGDCRDFVQRKISEIPINACDADVAALCSNSTGFTAQLTCINANVNNVSDDCRRLIFVSTPKEVLNGGFHRESSSRYNKLRRLGRKMCGDDVREFCSEERENGIEAMRDCLYDHYSELSEKCASFLDARANGEYSSDIDGDENHHHHKHKGAILIGLIVFGLLLACCCRRRCKKRWHERRMRWEQYRQMQMGMQMQPTQMMAVPVQGPPPTVPQQSQGQPQSSQTVMYAAAPYTGTYSNQLLSASPVAYNP